MQEQPREIVSDNDLMRTYIHKEFGWRAVEISKNKRWLPMNDYLFMACIVAYLMGDGNLSKERTVGDFRFYGSLVKLDNIKKSMYALFNLEPYMCYPHPKGGGYILRYNNCIFSRLLELVGVPRGNKMLSRFSVPNWIMNGNKNVKKIFLSALLSDEIGTIYRNKKGSWAGLKFKMSRSKSYLEDLIFFLNQIRKLLDDFGVSTTQVRIGKTEKFARKDGVVTYPAMFSIYTRYSNRKIFYQNVGFIDEEKQKHLNKSILEA